MEGYVYVLSTPATRLLKIGKTQRNPEIRAQELSSGTGTPFPYEVVYSVYVDDCSALELCVHRRLACKRANPKREFFDVTIEEAIMTIESFLSDSTSASRSERGINIDTASGGGSYHAEPVNTEAAFDGSNFDPVSHIRKRMVEGSKAKIAVFKTIFISAANAYRLIRSLEGKPMRSGKPYPPISIHISTDCSGIYISFLNASLGFRPASYNMGGLPPLYGSALDPSPQQIATKIADEAAPVFLLRQINENDFCRDGSRYNPNDVYTPLSYRASLIESSDKSYGFVDIKPDLINYLEGFAGLDYLAAKYLDFPYAPVQSSPSLINNILAMFFGGKVASSTETSLIKEVCVKALPPPK